MARKYVMLLLVGLIWGSQFIFQQAALASFVPPLVGVGRAIAGFITLYLLCRLLNIQSKAQYPLRLYMLIGLLEAAVPFTLVPWGQQFVSTSETSVLMGTIPFFVILLMPLIGNKSRITMQNVSSILVGFVGLVVLFLPQIKSSGGISNFTGALSILGASSSFAAALLLLSNLDKEHPLIVARNILAAASIQLLVICLIFKEPLPTTITASSALSILYLGVM
ncbi:DMT family transporter [Vibrio marisflavi]|uniref:EamA domain-containing protein n=1 Tax=Vibrio marisflavi CECT 7928 TaxID=634439 RepID=A0ABN8E0M4_9VIBR|nr:DMT family transporter [Vibrio marisflavi]CAH0537791.1 hypothetical protein VMF7928_01344 [Vibrio marisflavi CECT 7928]